MRMTVWCSDPVWTNSGGPADAWSRPSARADHKKRGSQHVYVDLRATKSPRILRLLDAMQRHST